MRFIQLSNETLHCKITPEIGGAIYNFDYCTPQIQQTLLRPTWGEEAHLITDFASWPLVPFSNRIKHGKFSFEGQNYRIPVNHLGYPHASHGHGWERPWQVVQQDDTSCQLAFSLDDQSIWPFLYTAQQDFKLTENELSLTLSLTNTGKGNMPAGLGIHPYFPKPEGTCLKAQVTHLWEIDASIIPTMRVAVPPEFDFANGQTLDTTNLDHCFEGYGGDMRITWQGRKIGLKITSSPTLNRLVVYTPPGKDFFCAEPVSHMPDAINQPSITEAGLVTLGPGESAIAHYQFTAVPQEP